MPETELVDLAKNGTQFRQHLAILALVKNDKGDTLMAIARAAPGGLAEAIIQSYCPTANADSDAKAKAAVGAYLTFLEEQLKSDSPNLPTDSAIAMLGYAATREEHGIGNAPKPAPGYQYKRIIADLIDLLNDKRELVRSDAALALGPIGGYTAEQAKETTTALEAYRQTVVAQPAAMPLDRGRQRAFLMRIDMSIERIKKEQEMRKRFGVEGETKPAATQPAATQAATPSSWDAN